MARLTLPSVEYLREILDYNPVTGSLTWKPRPLHHFVSPHGMSIWNARYAMRTAGTTGIAKQAAVIAVIINRKRFLAHRIIWKIVCGEDPPFTIDHKNRNPTDNAWLNLRSADLSQQGFNRSIETGNTSGFKGVSWHSGGNKWLAQIVARGCHYSLGLYSTPEAAHEAYCTAAKEIHGEFWSDGKPGR